MIHIGPEHMIRGAADQATLPGLGLAGSLYLTAVSAGSILLSFFFYWIVIVQVGPGIETDALFAGMAVPQVIISVIGGSLTRVLVPLLAGEDRGQALRDTWGFFAISGIVFGVLAILMGVLAPLWVPILFPGFSAVAQALSVQLAQIQLAGMVLTALSGVLLASYHVQYRFLAAEILPFLAALFALIVLVWILPRYGIAGAAWTTVLRGAMTVGLLIWRMPGYRRPSMSSNTLLEGLRRLGPLLTGSAYYKTDPIVDRFLASMAASGGLSLLYLGQTMYGSVAQIVHRVITAPMVPRLSTHAKDNEWREFRALYRSRLLWVIAAPGLIYLVLLVWGAPLLRLLIGHGDVTLENVRLLWWVLVALGGVLVGGALGQVLASVFYSRGDTTTPTKVGIIGFTIGLLLKIAAYLHFGLLGIAIGASLYYFLNAAVLWLLIESVTHHEIRNDTLLTC